MQMGVNKSNGRTTVGSCEALTTLPSCSLHIRLIDNVAEPTRTVPGENPQKRVHFDFEQLETDHDVSFSRFMKGLLGRSLRSFLV